MNYNDSFEFEVPSGEVYNVEVNGDTSDLENLEITITDSLGQLLDADHDHYAIIVDGVRAMEHEFEVHGADFDHYEHAFNNFLREKEDFV